MKGHIERQTSYVRKDSHRKDKIIKSRNRMWETSQEIVKIVKIM